ncbi:TPA: hypothetical protein RVR73_000424 [Aeromonas hydrophila]|nr:hypothetical protein [Aeromonas hydrophila]
MTHPKTITAGRYLSLGVVDTDEIKSPISDKTEQGRECAGGINEGAEMGKKDSS